MFMKALVNDGWDIQHTSSGHFRLRPPRDVLDRHPQASAQIIIECSPSDWRSLRNTKARIRREYGLTY